MIYSLYSIIFGEVLFIVGFLLNSKKDVARKILIIGSAVVFWVSKLIITVKLIHNGAGIFSAIIFVFFGGLTSCGIYVNYFDFIDVPVWALVIFILLDVTGVLVRLGILTNKSK